jgi:uncharacterized protein (TIGR02246 family)
MRTRLPALLATLAVLTLPACTPSAPAATGSAADEQAIRDLSGKYADAYSKRDTAALGALVTEDYQDVDPTGKHTQGHTAFQAAAAQEFAMMPAGVQMNMSATTVYVRWMDANTAVAGGTWEVSPAMAGMPSKGSWMGVVSRHDGGWQMQEALGAADMSGMAMPDAMNGKKP